MKLNAFGKLHKMMGLIKRSTNEDQNVLKVFEKVYDSRSFSNKYFVPFKNELSVNIIEAGSLEIKHAIILEYLRLLRDATWLIGGQKKAFYTTENKQKYYLLLARNHPQQDKIKNPDFIFQKLPLKDVKLNTTQLSGLYLLMMIDLLDKIIAELIEVSIIHKIDIIVLAKKVDVYLGVFEQHPNRIELEKSDGVSGLDYLYENNNQDMSDSSEMNLKEIWVSKKLNYENFIYNLLNAINLNNDQPFLKNYSSQSGKNFDYIQSISSIASLHFVLIDSEHIRAGLKAKEYLTRYNNTFNYTKGNLHEKLFQPSSSIINKNYINIFQDIISQ